MRECFRPRRSYRVNDARTWHESTANAAVANNFAFLPGERICARYVVERSFYFRVLHTRAVLLEPVRQIFRSI